MTHARIHPLCTAIGRAIAVRGVPKKALAAHLDVGPGAVSKWIHGQVVPDVDTVCEIERFLGLYKGQLWIEAGLVDIAAKPEDMASVDPRLDNTHRSLARAYYLSCLEGSTSTAVVAKERRSPRMSASSAS